MDADPCNVFAQVPRCSGQHVRRPQYISVQPILVRRGSSHRTAATVNRYLGARVFSHPVLCRCRHLHTFEVLRAHSRHVPFALQPPDGVFCAKGEPRGRGSSRHLVATHPRMAERLFDSTTPSCLVGASGASPGSIGELGRSKPHTFRGHATCRQSHKRFSQGSPMADESPPFISQS